VKRAASENEDDLRAGRSYLAKSIMDRTFAGKPVLKFTRTIAIGLVRSNERPGIPSGQNSPWASRHHTEEVLSANENWLVVLLFSHLQTSVVNPL